MSDSTSRGACAHGTPGGPGDALVEVSGLTMSYGVVRALDGLDMTLARQIVGLLGENGCGRPPARPRVSVGLLGRRAQAGHAPGPESKPCPSCPTRASCPIPPG